MKKVNALVLGLAVLLMVGCGKDEAAQPQNDPDNIASSKGCVPVTSKAHGAYGIEDREFIYNANGQVKRVITARNNVPVSLELITYSPTGKITQINYYTLPARQLNRRSKYQYNADSLVSKEILMFPATPSDSTTIRPTSEYSFDYDAAKRLTKITQSSYLLTIPNSYSNITYAQNNIVTKEDYAGDPVTIGWRSVTQYIPNGKAPGNNLTYFNLPPRYPGSYDEILLGLLPVTLETTQYHMGSAVSQNTFNYSYVYNAEGYPIERTLNFPGQQPLTNYWTYSCQ